jgi:hypothetical protein
MQTRLGIELLVFLGCGAVGLVVLGCGAGEPANSPADAQSELREGAGARRKPRSNGPSVESEIGALDENAVDAAFKKARPDINKCLRDANDGLDMHVVGGEIEIKLRVKSDGTLRWAYPSRSTLGQRTAAKCVIAALNNSAWPKPEGGDEGLATTAFAIDPPGRAPVQWQEGDLGSARSQVRAALTTCMNEAGTSSLSVTLYIDPDGNLLTAGGAAGDENGSDAIDCAIAAIQKITFPSPGSYPGKVTITVP